METIPVPDAAAKSYPLSPEIAKSPTIGPFKYVTASADTIELVRDDNWAGPAEACSGKACLDAVTYKFFPDNKEGMIAAFLAGEIDVALDLVQADYDAIKDVDPAVGTAILEPAWLYEHLDMNQAGLGQGKGHPALKDLKVRQAIAGAIDKKAMWNTVFPGQPYPDVPLCVNATPTNYWQLPNAECLDVRPRRRPTRCSTRPATRTPTATVCARCPTAARRSSSSTAPRPPASARRAASSSPASSRRSASSST